MWASGQFSNQSQEGWRRLAYRCTYPVALLVPATSPKADSWRTCQKPTASTFLYLSVFLQPTIVPGGLFTFASSRLPPNRRPLRPRPHLRLRLASVSILCILCILCIPTVRPTQPCYRRRCTASVSPRRRHCCQHRHRRSGKRSVSALHIPTLPISLPLGSEAPSADYTAHRAPFAACFIYLVFSFSIPKALGSLSFLSSKASRGQSLVLQEAEEVGIGEKKTPTGTADIIGIL
ncbi:hypothetical protein F5B21DRAFT_233496 [Xylaria acuta]|nr:hypothetical protein F5B21DRAFT_233496 [Xylaria acuta]